MAVIIKTEQEIEKLREGGKRLGEIVRLVAKKVAPGVTTRELDIYTRELISAQDGDTPAFLNYTPYGADYPYPAALITSVNAEVVHGIPGDYVLKMGDIISLDCGLKHAGLFTDHAITVPVGPISKEATELLRVTREALYFGIDQARAGNYTGDIGYAIEQYVKKFGYGIVRDLSGHGVGREIHEDPYVPNYGKKGKGELLKKGMTIAIEPMLNIGKGDVVTLKDGYTVKTLDNSLSAHFEHTVLITDGDPEILTE